ncbi:MAG: hypothetical protein JWO42_772, partial [Chloroflexi bacterium]|nr:hypothetical protein [Chloroflexota bacterium]
HVDRELGLKPVFLNRRLNRGEERGVVQEQRLCFKHCRLCRTSPRTKICAEGLELPGRLSKRRMEPKHLVRPFM